MTNPANGINHTICAISTPPGIGGIAVARVSGPDAIEIADMVWKGHRLTAVASHTARLGYVIEPDGTILDQAVATVFRAPSSFTGENVVEISVHGSRYVQRRLIEILIQAGAELASPGEFTRRAFASGKIDLAEAEAVADVIASNSRAAHRIAISQLRGGFSKRIASLRSQLLELASLLELELDFSEEEVEFASRAKLRALATEIHAEVTRLHRSFASGQAIKEGIPVAIVGQTNAGKSSLLNALLGDERAIVSDIHGTTRDTIEETLESGDYLYRFIDTAGIRATTDRIEQIGIQRSIDAINRARIIILVIDPDSQPNSEIFDQIRKAAPQTTIIFAVNKTDTAASDAITRTINQLPTDIPATVVTISALTRHGIDNLLSTLDSTAHAIDGNDSEGILVTNLRHAQALARAAESTARVITGLDTDLPGDLIAQDLRETLTHLSTITGHIPSTEILTTIFSRFCIGK